MIWYEYIIAGVSFVALEVVAEIIAELVARPLINRVKKRFNSNDTQTS